MHSIHKPRPGMRKILASKRFWAALLLAVMLVMGIQTIFSFSRMEADVSNSLSKAVTARIQSLTDRYFDINPKDSFWRQDLNNIVRKVGHVAEYFLLGLLVCSFLHVLVGRQIVALLASPLVCFLVAVLDERLQLYAVGRGPRMADVWLDTAAASVGVLLMGIVVFLIQLFFQMRRKIRLYEQTCGTHPDASCQGESCKCDEAV